MTGVVDRFLKYTQKKLHHLENIEVCNSQVEVDFASLKL